MFGAGASASHHVLSEAPVVGDNVHEGEGHREGAEEDVRHRHVHDEDVPSCVHFLGTRNFSWYAP